MSKRFNRRALLAGLGAAAVLPAFSAHAANLRKVRALGILRITVYQDFAPWAWRDAEGLRGIDVDLGSALAEALGVKPQFVELIADESVDDDLRNGVWRGGLLGQAPGDVMMHVPVDRVLALRNDRAVIQAPYYRESFAMACSRAIDCEVPPPQLKGRKLVAELDSVPDFYLSGSFGGALRGNVRHVLSGQAAVDAVAKDEADAVVATRAQIEHGMARAGEKMVQRKGPLPAMTSPGWNIGLAVRDDSRDLGDALEGVIEQLTASGRMVEIFRNYGVEHRPPVLV